MNLRDVPDDVAAVLVAAAGGSRQSLSAFVVDRLSEVAQAVRAADCLPPTQSLAGPVSRCKTWWPRCGRCARPRELGSRRRVSPRRVLRGRRPPARSGRRATEGGWLAVRARALDEEIVSTMRGMARHNQGLDQVVPRALTHLAGFSIRRMPPSPLLDRLAGHLGRPDGWV